MDGREGTAIHVAKGIDLGGLCSGMCYCVAVPRVRRAAFAVAGLRRGEALAARFLVDADVDAAAALREEDAFFFGRLPPGRYELTSFPSVSTELLRSSRVRSNM
jgi:hypothetical protein